MKQTPILTFEKETDGVDDDSGSFAIDLYTMQTWKQHADIYMEKSTKMLTHSTSLLSPCLPLDQISYF